MNKLNWPTAFIITAIIFAGAFIYNKPTDAGLGSSEMIMQIPNDVNTHKYFQLKGDKIRLCEIRIYDQNSLVGLKDETILTAFPPKDSGVVTQHACSKWLD